MTGLGGDALRLDTVVGRRNAGSRPSTTCVTRQSTTVRIRRRRSSESSACWTR
ncbi:MAG TPA: hypothetical protein VKP11_01110 [Frankiaceae bacterium]|nr:hypothetical protein [Frankiaceae bacterium]